MKKIDCHRHCSRKEEDFENLKISAQNANIEKIILFGHNGLAETGFDDFVWSLYEKQPELIIPFSCGFTFQQSDITYVENALKKGFYGLGEILVGHDGARRKSFENLEYDSQICIDIFKKAGEFNAPVLVHCNEGQVDGLLSAIKKCPNTTFIWAHIGFNFPSGFDADLRDANEIYKFLEENQNLYFDISFWKKNALCMDNTAYLELFEKFSERFIFGMDLTHDYVNMQNEYYENYSIVLSKLSQKAQENIYYNNMNKMLSARFQNA